jgi:uncharacterized metal-binding protein YceD (DUF177 family)
LNIENQYIIHFKGLKEGVHEFAFSLEKPFFEAHEHLEVPDGKVSVQVRLTRKLSFMEMEVILKGEILAQCDRCLSIFRMPVNYVGTLVVRFSESEQETADDIWILHPDESQIDLQHYLYECIGLSLPIRKVHPDMADGRPGCDNDMLQKLNETLVS